MELILLGLFGITLLVLSALASRRTGIAAPLVLLLLGIAASYVPWLPELQLTEEMILLGVLPPLLYASGSNVPVMDLRRNITSIAWLSGVMVIIPALIIGYVTHLVFPEISLPLAIALGAAVAPTDAVAATSIGKRLGLPDRIMVLLEGESLFNDAAALVTLRMAIAAIASSFSLMEAAGLFLWAVIGGLAIGLGLGYVLSLVRSKLDDPVLVTVVTLATPWAVYIPAEKVHSSGVIAVVVAAVLMAHLAPRQLAADERAMVRSTWATGAYILEHAVFLLMGMQMAFLVPRATRDGGLTHVWQLAAIILALLIVLRVIAVAVPVILSRIGSSRAGLIIDKLDQPLPASQQDRLRERFGDDWEDMAARWLGRTRADMAYAQSEAITVRGGAVLAWAGMRGVVTLAAIQTIPFRTGGVEVEHRSWVVLTAFTVAVASLLLFGGTMPYVIRHLGLSGPDVHERAQEEKQLMKSLFRSVNAELGPFDEQTIDGQPIDPAIIAQFKTRMSYVSAKSNTEVIKMERDSKDIYRELYTRYLQALRAALEEERAIGAYSHHALRAAEHTIDRFDSSTRPRV